MIISFFCSCSERGRMQDAKIFVSKVRPFHWGFQEIILSYKKLSGKIRPKINTVSADESFIVQQNE